MESAHRQIPHWEYRITHVWATTTSNQLDFGDYHRSDCLISTDESEYGLLKSASCGAILHFLRASSW
jgi:hypothetical protein